MLTRVFSSRPVQLEATILVAVGTDRSCARGEVSHAQLANDRSIKIDLSQVLVAIHASMRAVKRGHRRSASFGVPPIVPALWMWSQFDPAGSLFGGNNSLFRRNLDRK